MARKFHIRGFDTLPLLMEYIFDNSISKEQVDCIQYIGLYQLTYWTFKK